MDALDRPARLWPLALLLALAPLRAQTAPPAGAPVFGETVEVRVVNLEAVVTDRDGLPVTGLPPSDFLLKVDGKEIPIGYFSEVRGGDAIELTAEEGRAPVPGVPALAPGTPVGTSFLVFVDDFFAIKRDRNAVLERLVDQLPRLGPEDRMAVVAFDGKSLTMLTTWSGSTSSLARAFKAALDRPAFGLDRKIELRTLENERRDNLRSGFGSSFGLADRLEPFELDFAQRLEGQVHNVVSAASATLRGFASPPGRKVMILLSGGWPYEVAEFAAGDQLDRSINEAAIHRGVEIFAPLVDTANQLGYTLYTVDVPGLAGSGVDAGEGFAGESANLEVPFHREVNLQMSLSQVARQTGGKAMINAARLEAFETVQKDTRSYYWLGFSPTWKGDDSRHRVELSLRRPGLRLRSRDGFVDISRTREVSMSAESALLFGNPPSADPLGLELGELQTGKLGRMTVPITVSVPGELVTFLPAPEGGQIARLELRIAAIDERGGRSEVPVIPVDIKARRAAHPGEKVTFQNSVELRRIKQRLLVSLFDPASGRLFTAMRDVRP